MRYIETLNLELQEYLKILSPDFPEFLEEYIATPEMQRLSKISQNIGWDYSSYKKIKYFASKLSHSVGVALVVWHFTHDKKQTLAGLFHDIASPVFLHAIDFMNGDSEHQESTEDRTYEIIYNSKDIMRLLLRDGITIQEVADYHIYPIADNDTPKLSADRLEYTFSCALVQPILNPNTGKYECVLSIDDIKRFYSDMVVSYNEAGIEEIAFKNKQIAEEYICKISKLWPTWADENNKAYMQFLADIVKSMIVKGYLTVDDLYKLPEREVVDMILNSKDLNIATAMNNFIHGKEIKILDYPLPNRYCIKMKGKLRYIVPLVAGQNKAVRITEISKIAKEKIDGFLSNKFDKYGCLDFDFKPYNLSNKNR